MQTAPKSSLTRYHRSGVPQQNGACTGDLLDAIIAHVTSPSFSALRFIPEFWIPVSNERADLVAANGHLAGFEIKGPGDRLDRLPRQVLAYGRIFDLCTAVVAERHLGSATPLLPGWWGIATVPKPNLELNTIRLPEPNPSVDPETLSRLLWRDELCEAFRQLGGAPDAHLSRGQLRTALIARLSIDELRTVVRTALIGRADSSARIPTRRYAAAGSSRRS